MELTGGGFALRNLTGINAILGKNACGKSTVLKSIENGIDKNAFGSIRYISPERGGVLNYEANIEQNMINQPTWMGATRRKNQSENFRQQSMALFRRLQLLVLTGIERDHVLPGYTPRSFDTELVPINELLERVRIERDDPHQFKIVDRDTGEPAAREALSSGEAELISLAIECLSFKHECAPDKQNVLLIDEPDVHLHPDLQNRLARFMSKTFRGTNVTLILATHSTALLAGLSEHEPANIFFMTRGQTELDFQEISEIDRLILPIFGAHPLSNVFNEAPVLLVEGDDDERVWQQAIRSADGGIRFFPCVVDGKGHFAEVEREVNKVISAVYDNAIGFSLRDRDDGPEEIQDVGHLTRLRLSCRASENLLLSNDVLRMAGTDWATLVAQMESWISANTSHKYHSDMVAFRDGGYDRKGFDLKNVRNILLGMFSNKPWEVLVGKTIAQTVKRGGDDGDDGLKAFLGEKVCVELLHLDAPDATSYGGEGAEVATSGICPSGSMEAAPVAEAGRA